MLLKVVCQGIVMIIKIVYFVIGITLEFAQI